MKHIYYKVHHLVSDVTQKLQTCFVLRMKRILHVPILCHVKTFLMDSCRASVYTCWGECETVIIFNLCVLACRG